MAKQPGSREQGVKKSREQGADENSREQGVEGNNSSN